MNPMPRAIAAVFYIVALVCFVLAMFQTRARVDLIATGLAAVTAVIAWDTLALA